MCFYALQITSIMESYCVPTYCMHPLDIGGVADTDTDTAADRHHHYYNAHPPAVHINSYVTVDESAGRALFYVFAEARTPEPTKAPLMLWLNG